MKSKFVFTVKLTGVSLLLCLAVWINPMAVSGADITNTTYGDELRHNKTESVHAVENDVKNSNPDLVVLKQADVTALINEKADGITSQDEFGSKPVNVKPAVKTPTAKVVFKEHKNIVKKTQVIKPRPKPVTAASDEWMQRPGDEKRNRPTDQLARHLSIDQALKTAKSIPVPTTTINISNVSSAKTFDSQTDAELIDGLVSPELQKSMVDLDFNDATLSDVFMTLGKSGNINVMLDPELKDLMIDIYLKKVSLKEAFILMGVSYNLGFKRIENSLFVTTKDKLLQQSVAYKVIKLHNVKAQEVKNMVTDLIRVVNVSEQINSLIVIGQPEEITKVEGVVKAVDVPQPQVILEASIVEVNKDALKDLGVDWSDQISMSYQETGRPVDIPNVATSSDSLLNIGAFERNPLSFSTIIKILENQNKAKVLSNPRVTTMNEKEAEIFVGDRIPYTINTVSGGVTTTEVRFEEPGIRLKITPMIIDGDFVVVKVEPEVSFIFAFRGPDGQFPWVKKRQATAFVRIRNNQPFVLGGLLTQEEKKNLFKVPLLGDVPWLGNLFSYEKHSVTDTELIITITPTVVQGNF